MRACVPRLKPSRLTSPISNVQQGLAVTTDQAREILEKIITDSRTALIEVRGEGLLALQAAMTQHEEALRALHTTLTDQVRCDLLGIRTELDALGQTGYKGKKGGGAKGFGGKGKGEKGPNGAINGSCWNCGLFGHRQSDCPGIRAGSGQQNQDKGGKNKGNKDDGKGFWTKGKGKGINEITWDGSYDGVASSSWGSTDPCGD